MPVLMSKYVGYEPPQDEAVVPGEEEELSDEGMEELSRVFGLPVRPPKQ